MKIGGLTIFERRGRGRADIASWHSPHSLTWSWILTVGWAVPRYVKPHWQWEAVGPHKFRGASIGSLINAHAMRNNNGWQWGFAVLGLSLSWSHQYPMWFRDLYWRRESERYERRQAA
ncbi:hypothetical protein SB2_11730 [Methylobacterium radiotolerans]|nr:hypothetical protein SB3_10925 [Methylobacterium radiotolerans]KTS47963.1 hypothetical protein SB2_11730 [Methylobacterium radiotolerans]